VALVLAVVVVMTPTGVALAATLALVLAAARALVLLMQAPHGLLGLALELVRFALGPLVELLDLAFGALLDRLGLPLDALAQLTVGALDALVQVAGALFDPPLVAAPATLGPLLVMAAALGSLAALAALAPLVALALGEGPLHLTHAVGATLDLFHDLVQAVHHRLGLLLTAVFLRLMDRALQLPGVLLELGHLGLEASELTLELLLALGGRGDGQGGEDRQHEHTGHGASNPSHGGPWRRLAQGDRAPKRGRG
jgi:hypothetical protein